MAPGSSSSCSLGPCSSLLRNLPCSMKKRAPDTNQRWRKIIRPLRYPARYLLRIKPLAFLDFLRMQNEWPFIFAAIHPDEFLACFFAGFNAQDLVRNGGQSKSQFLLHLT